MNPDRLRQQYEVISRARLYTEDRLFENDEDTLKVLQRLIEHTMPPLIQSAIHMSSSSTKEADDEGKVPFRLVSASMQPTTISLCPRPAPPPLTREPDAEDTHEQAVTRRRRSEAVAIDGSTILRTSVMERSRLDKRKATSHGRPAPALLLIMRTQQRRKTRPPVLPSELRYHPYNSAIINPRAQVNVNICPTLDVDPMEANTIKSSRRQRRKRRRALNEDHSKPAKFWRPNATWSGPCKGYAYGYR